MDYKHMTQDDIIEWCQANGQVEWLKEIINKPIPTYDEEGQPLDERDITFVELKVAFVNKFMPEIKPAAKPIKPSMKDRINAL